MWLTPKRSALSICCRLRPRSCSPKTGTSCSSTGSQYHPLGSHRARSTSSTGRDSKKGTASLSPSSIKLKLKLTSISSPLDISEAFARGQNPQHWHVARRGIGIGSGVSHVDGATVATTGEAYFEVFRKETSLTDVDNALMGIVRKVFE